MRTLLLAAAAALLTAPLAAPLALAQDAVAPPAGLSTTGESVGITQPFATQGVGVDSAHPTFRLFGIPVQVSSPVNAPYYQSSMQTFAGQPMNGADAVVTRSMGAD